MNKYNAGVIITVSVTDDNYSYNAFTLCLATIRLLKPSSLILALGY